TAKIIRELASRQKQHTLVYIQNFSELPNQMVRCGTAPVMLDIVEVLRRNRCVIFFFPDPCRQFFLTHGHSFPSFGNLPTETHAVLCHCLFTPIPSLDHAVMLIRVVIADAM